MSKRIEAKHKIDRRMGENIWGRPKSPVNRREYGPGQHGQRRKGKLSDYGVQLRAKQKLKRYYANIVEKQFRGIYDEAIRMKGDSGANMIGLLERRLDAMVYRAKFVPTVFAARQFVNHGHVKVHESKRPPLGGLFRFSGEADRLTSGRRALLDRQALLLEQALQFAGLEHLAHDVAAADELALHVELRNGRPAGIGLDALA